MYKDFKENYIEQQKKQAQARQARLAKIGMGTAASATSPASASAERSPQKQVTSGRPVSATVSGGQKPSVVQSQKPASVRPAVRYVNEDSEKKGQATQSAPQRRPVTAPSPTQNTVNKPVQNDVAKESADPSVGAKRPAQRPVTASAPTSSAPSQTQTQPPQRSAQTQKRPVQARTPKAHPQHPVQQQAQQNAASNGNKKGSAYNSRRMVYTDSDIFKKELSDSESRAMMFALTGKAEQPSDGGEVDIINMGRISTPKKEKNSRKKKSSVGAYIGRSLAAVASLILFVVIVVFASIGVIAHGPSETVRDLLVQSAMQASATKWVPYIFLPAETVDGIINKSEEVVQDIVSLEDYSIDTDTEIKEDEWANAQDGMIFETVSGSTFKAYVLLVKDPSRVFCGTSTDDFSNSKAGVDVFHAAERYGAVACINAGEFLDNGGHGSGYAPLGLTYSQGKCVFKDNTPKTFMGFDKDNKLIVREGMTEAEADELGIRDAVCFQNNNTLIQKDGDNIILSYEDGNAGTSQRTAIGQREDGTVILIVTDGRSASSLGATHNDMIDLMVSYGAVTAGMLDGGSSAMMYYEDYYTKYGYDVSTLDEYQKMGLVNNYKAFTEPRKIPTFFMVKPE